MILGGAADGSYGVHEFPAHQPHDVGVTGWAGPCIPYASGR
jgi:hypothetical protein